MEELLDQIKTKFEEKEQEIKSVSDKLAEVTYQLEQKENELKQSNKKIEVLSAKVNNITQAVSALKLGD